MLTLQNSRLGQFKPSACPLHSLKSGAVVHPNGSRCIGNAHAVHKHQLARLLRRTSTEPEQLGQRLELFKPHAGSSLRSVTEVGGVLFKLLLCVAVHFLAGAGGLLRHAGQLLAVDLKQFAGACFCASKNCGDFFWGFHGDSVFGWLEPQAYTLKRAYARSIYMEAASAIEE